MKIQNLINNRKIINRSLLLILSCIFLFIFIGCPPYKSDENYIDTDGRVRGIASQGDYAYLAAGKRGLKIFNISNASDIFRIGELVTDGFNEQVDVDGQIAVLTDTVQNRVYIVDILNKSTPQLVWTYETLDEPTHIFIHDNLLYITEKGHNPQASTYFSGLEIILCNISSPPQQVSYLTINDITDVIVQSFTSYNYIYAVSKNKLYILSDSQGIINPSPLSVFSFSNTENIQSLDFCSYDHLLIFGNNLYCVDITNPASPVITDSELISGYEHNRVVSCGIVAYDVGPWGAPFSGFYFSEPYFFYSTQREFGWGRIDWENKDIILQEQFDLYAESEGHAKIYDIKMTYHGHSTNTLNPYVRDHKFVCAIGALDNYGLGYATIEEISWQEYMNP